MIIVHAKGDERIGIGNLSRSIELGKALASQHDVLCILECSEKLYNERYLWEKSVRAKNRNDSLNIISANSCKVYLCDLIDPDQNLSNFLKRLGAKIIYLNGLESGFEPDVLIVTDGFDYKVGNPFGSVFRGFMYYIVPEAVRLARPITYTRKQTLKKILIGFGGADPALFTEYLVKQIQDDNKQYSIVLGPAMSGERKADIQKIQKRNIQYIDSPASMLELILEHDFVVTLGGMTTYEAMALGVPVGAIRWEYMSFHTQSFHQKQMATDLGDIQQAYGNILNLDLERTNRFAQNAHMIIDGSALSNIYNIVTEYF